MRRPSLARLGCLPCCNLLNPSHLRRFGRRMFDNFRRRPAWPGGGGSDVTTLPAAIDLSRVVGYLAAVGAKPNHSRRRRPLVRGASRVRACGGGGCVSGFLKFQEEAKRTNRPDVERRRPMTPRAPARVFFPPRIVHRPSSVQLLACLAVDAEDVCLAACIRAPR